MFDGFFGIFQSHPDQVTELMAWKWAFEHPYLHFFIKLGTPTAWAIIIFTGFRITRRVFQR